MRIVKEYDWTPTLVVVRTWPLTTEELLAGIEEAKARDGYDWTKGSVLLDDE